MCMYIVDYSVVKTCAVLMKRTLMLSHTMRTYICTIVHTRIISVPLLLLHVYVFIYVCM